MNPTVKEEELFHYINDSKIIEFISINAPMDWNKSCDFVRDEDITNDYGVSFWEREFVFKTKETSTANEWMKHFYKAHPFLDKIVFVFND